MASKCLLIFAVVVGSAVAYWGPDLPPGPYCGRGEDGKCCNDRQDGCSHPILDTLCYCDQFCNRTASHDDCCPDYEPVCLGISEAQEAKPGCMLNGQVYFRGETAEKGCNQCICQYDESGRTADWQCEQDECVISQDVLDGLGRGGGSWRPSWRATSYPQFANKKLKDAKIFKLGTLPLSTQAKRMTPIRHDKDIDYQQSFDARQRWQGYISPVVDQGWCGSDWAVALTGVASDRFAIQSNGAESILLSPQTLISCNVRSQRGCQGGNIDNAWIFARNVGLLDDICFPYRANMTSCPFQKGDTKLPATCRPSVQERKTRYKVGPVYRLSNERDIMYDIMETGPVLAIMEVYQDFFHYQDGIYRHTSFGDRRPVGLHSVRVVGWGQEGSQRYWTVANSWGAEWGDRGYFKIVRGENESGIESFVVAAFSEVVAYARK